MKKNIIAILSFGLFLFPFGSLAQVTAEYCAGFLGDSCPNGCFAPHGSPEEPCYVCGEGKYSNDGLQCKDCSKPKNAEFVTSPDGLYSGMAGPQECPWSIQVCDKNTYIANLTWKDWNASTELTKSQCESCPLGKHADNTIQEWDGNALSDPCEPKKFYITIKLHYPVLNDSNICEDHTEEYEVRTNGKGYTFPTDTTNRKIIGIQEIMDYTKSKIDYEKYQFPSAGTYTMTSENKPEGLKDIQIIIANDTETNTSYLSFQTGIMGNTGGLTNLAAYPHEHQFYLDINLNRITNQKIYYCPSKITNQGLISGTCSNSIIYDECNQPTVLQYSDIASSFKIEQQKEQCANGKYSNSWMYITNEDGYNWEKATKININETIKFPDKVKELYLAPVLDECEQGTYNNTGICPIECQKCPTGFTTQSTATEHKTDCYIDTTMTFNDENGTSSTVISLPVYYVGNQ